MIAATVLAILSVKEHLTDQLIGLEFNSLVNTTEIQPVNLYDHTFPGQA